MPTIIELHFLAYFSLIVFISIAIKIFLKTKANTLVIIAFGIMFAIIKLLLDIYLVKLVYQILIITFYILISNLIVHKLNHVSKLMVSAVLFGIYYLCLMGINYFINTIILGKTINYISNYYLVFIMGLNFILFAIFCLVLQYLKGQNPLKLTQDCVLTLSNSKIRLVGFIDTGNSLKEPKTNANIAIISFNSLKNYLSNKMYADIMFATNSSGQFNNISKLAYTTISGTNYITVFKPEQFTVSGKNINCFVGITFQKLTYDCLLFSGV